MSGIWTLAILLVILLGAVIVYAITYNRYKRKDAGTGTRLPKGGKARAAQAQGG